MATRVVIDSTYQAKLDVVVTAMLGKLGEAIASDASRLAPVRTGKLRESVASEPPTPKQVTIRATAPYAGYVELGTRYMSAQPYLKPATYRQRAV